MTRLSIFLEEERKKTEFIQIDFAKKIGISSAAYSRFVTGSIIKTRTLKKIMDSHYFEGKEEFLMDLFMNDYLIVENIPYRVKCKLTTGPYDKNKINSYLKMTRGPVSQCLYSDHIGISRMYYQALTNHEVDTLPVFKSFYVKTRGNNEKMELLKVFFEASFAFYGVFIDVEVCKKPTRKDLKRENQNESEG